MAPDNLNSLQFNHEYFSGIVNATSRATQNFVVHRAVQRLSPPVDDYDTNQYVGN